MCEPLASLDSMRQDRGAPIYCTLADRIAVPILYVSHSVSEIQVLADLLVLVENGTGALADDPDTVLNRFGA